MMLGNSRTKRNIEEQQNQERHWSIGAQDQRNYVHGQRNKRKNKSKGEKTKRERKGGKIKVEGKQNAQNPSKHKS